MDQQVLEQKLESLRCCVQRVETKIPKEVTTLATDIDLQDIVSLNLSRAVQICVDIGAHLIAGMDVAAPDTMGQTFDLLAQQGVLSSSLATRLKKAVGFRNIAVHQYVDIDWEIVYLIITNNLDDFKIFSKEVICWMEK